MKEACGVFGVYAPGKGVAQLTFDGMYALQHRGQESAGMAVSDGEAITVVKDMGLVTTVFDERTIACLPGDLAMGHTRYSTTGASEWRNAQPVYRSVGGSGFALGHNGNLTNTAALAERAGMLPGVVASDSDLVAELLARAVPGPGRGRHHAATGRSRRRCGPVLPLLEGAFSFVAPRRHPRHGRARRRTGSGLCVSAGSARPTGPRAGCWRRRPPPSTSWGPPSSASSSPVSSSSSTTAGCAREQVIAAERIDPHLCIFEFVYFARPDSRLYGREVHAARRRMGERLAAQAPVDADLVMGVPESGVPAAEGFARATGIPHGQGLVKNRYIGRTFITPGQGAREDERAAQAQPAAGEHRRASGSWSSTTPSCAAPPSGPWSGCCARPEPARSTCASPARR